MIVDAVHVTERAVALEIAARMLAGQQGLLNMPADMTVGGCFWTVALPPNSGGSLIHQELPNPYSGRSPIAPVRLRLRVDLGAPMTFTLPQLAIVHAEIVLGLAGQAAGLSSLRAVIAHAGPPQQSIVGGVHAQHRTLQHLQTLVGAIADWLRGPDPSYNNCPVDAAYFGLNNQQHRAVFTPQGINAAQGQLWNEVGRRIGAGPGRGWVQLPAGCYLSRRGGGNFAVVRNALVQQCVQIVDSAADLTQRAREAKGHHSRAGDLG